MATGSEIETKPGGNSTMVEDVQKVPVNGKTSDFQPEMQSQRVSFKLEFCWRYVSPLLGSIESSFYGCPHC